MDSGRADKVCAEIRAMGRRAVPIIADVLDDAQIDRVFAETEEQLGGLDIMVTIVGASKVRGILEMTAADWDLDQSRNLRYVFLYMQAAAHSFISHDRPGAIVTMTSGGALRSMPFRSAYGAAKAAMIHLVKSMAVELGEYGIRVNAVAPGITVTPSSAGRTNHEEAFHEELRKIPSGRFGTPDDVGKAVLFLCSDLAGHVTGHTLAVDGGWVSAPNYNLDESRAITRRKREPLIGSRS
jgi:NAD(P)-dependent dehydrogenase (short-subunit alcohol dehydrogenase family)